MQKYMLCFLSLLMLSTNTVSAQRNSIYFPNNETELMLLERPNQLAIAYGISPTLTSNVQVGYSPIKHLSFAAAYFGRNQKPNDSNRKMRRAYTAGLGTYFIFGSKGKWRKTVAEDKEEGTKQINSWLLNMQAGYSINQMYWADIPETGIMYTISEIDFNSLFCSFSLSHKYKWGLFTLSVSGRQLFYKKAFFYGNGFNLNQIVDITTQLQADNSFASFNIGVHNRIGKIGTGFYGIIGGNLPTIYFQQFKNRAAEVDGGFLYMGVMVDVGELKNL